MKKIIMMALMMQGAVGMNGYDETTQRKRSGPNKRDTMDSLITTLVTKGMCYVDSYTFNQVRDVLPSKLRGQVLFHSMIENKEIFITYTKAKP